MGLCRPICHPSGVAGVGVTLGGNRRALKCFYILEMKIFAIFSFLHKNIEFIRKVFRWPYFSLLGLQKAYVVSLSCEACAYTGRYTDAFYRKQRLDRVIPCTSGPTVWDSIILSWPRFPPTSNTLHLWPWVVFTLLLSMGRPMTFRGRKPTSSLDLPRASDEGVVKARG